VDIDCQRPLGLRRQARVNCVDFALTAPRQLFTLSRPSRGHGAMSRRAKADMRRTVRSPRRQRNELLMDFHAPICPAATAPRWCQLLEPGQHHVPRVSGGFRPPGSCAFLCCAAIANIFCP